MSPPTAHVLVFDGFADWEPAHALAELRRSGGWTVRTIGFDEAPVTSMGGLRVSPDVSLDDVRPAETDLLILPGGDRWEGAYPRQPLERTLHALHDADVPLAAICGATLALARAGLLDEVAHTSNAPDYLGEHAPAYRGHARYAPQLAVREQGIITASGLGAVDFAREIFAEVALFTPEELALWYDLFKYGDASPSAARHSAGG